MSNQDTAGSAGSSTGMDTLQFAPFSTQIAPSLWTTLAAVKIDRLQLSDEDVPITARYSLGKTIVDRATGEAVQMPVSLSLDSTSLDAQASASSLPSKSGPYGSITCHGKLKNFNTVEDFKNADKAAILQRAGLDLLDTMLDQDVAEKQLVSALTSFLVLTFADLKKYKFIYWFAFPALIVSPPWQVRDGWEDAGAALGDETMRNIGASLQTKSDGMPSFFLVRPDGTIGSLTNFTTFFADTKEEDRIAAFYDPSPNASQPGWPLRNLLTLLIVRFRVCNIRILSWRDEVGSSVRASQSITGRVCCTEEASSTLTYESVELPLAANAANQPSVVGWERNIAGKLVPRMADLGPIMDPARLADQAVDLNLKLMRWRILPEINLEQVQSTKCLLLGAGTLGCYVARTLMGWGVRHITFVDSSTVSFSNPVRQPLFEFADCLEGGKAKAQCAADALRRIYPGARSRGYQLSIPMPGHPIAASALEKTQQDVRLLEDLFDEHDVIYLLMDSRESRWLPTVLGAAKSKLVMNAALGFDGFLAMRHGASPSQQAQYADTERLGCYFCNDIVAPTDSLTDRTLDQMCTVTRPGLAAVASASLVELTVSLLQHPLGAVAPAYKAPSSRDEPAESATSASSSSILGYLPHQLRGSLYTFNNLLIHGPAYDKCTACSTTVLDAYAAEGFDVVQRACNDETYLKSLTGLDKLYDATNEIEVDWSDEEAEADDDDGELL